MQMLFEKVRPRSWDEVIGHKAVKVSIARMKERGSLGGRAFWLSGLSGTGKTTIAYLVAAEVSDPENFIELDAGDITPAKLDDIERNLRFRAIGDKPGRAVLLNESHGLRKDTIRKLLVVLERIPNHVTWCFTTTSAGQQSLFDGIDAHPLLSRCIEFRLDHVRYLDAFAKRAMEIAEAEGLGGALLGEYVALAKRCQCNFRGMLSAIEAGEMIRDCVVA
jgi:DNA polymerase III delta prime subunit